MVFLREKQIAVGEFPPPKESEEEFGFVSDIDDLLADSWSDYPPVLNERFGTNLTLEEVAVWGYVQNVPQWRDLGEEFFAFMRSLRSKHDFVGNHKVIEGSLEGILALAEIGKLRAYVTTRPQSMWQVTLNWLRVNGFPQAPVFCLPNHLLLTPYEGAWKKKQMEGLGPQLILEDNGRFAETLSVKTIIVEGHTNRHFTPVGAHIIKVSHWRHVPEKAAFLKEEWLKAKDKANL